MKQYPILRNVKKHTRKLVSIHSTPEAIATGTGIGVYVAFTPFIGLQTALSVVLASLVGSNRLAAAIGVNLHTPVLWMWPGVFAAEYKIGQWLLGSHAFAAFQMSHLGWNTPFQVGLPILLGSLILGTPVGLLTFFVTKSAVKRYKSKHRKVKTPITIDEPVA